jgi:hypothetical protein
MPLLRRRGSFCYNDVQQPCSQAICVRRHNLQEGAVNKTLIGLVIAGVVASGCTGSFQLTRKVYNFHRSQSDKWMDEIFFLVVTLLPVYSLASFADAVIFNSIEFWTGKNPVETAAVPGADETLVLSHDEATDHIVVASRTAQGEVPRFVIERGPDGVLARDVQGNVLMRSIATPEGGIALHDRQARLVKTYSADDVERLSQRALEN